MVYSTQCICKNSRSTGQEKAIKLSRTTNAFTATVRTRRSIPSVKIALLNYAGAYELWHGFSFAHDQIKNIIGNVILTIYLPIQLCSSYIRYVRFGRFMTKNAEVLPMADSLNEIWFNGRELRIMHMVNKMFYASTVNFDVFVIELVDVYISHSRKS